MPKRKGARFTAPLPLFSSSITCYLLQTPWLSLNKDPKLLKEKEQFVKVQSLSTTQEKKSTEAEHPELWYQGCCHLLLPAIISGYHFAVQPSGIISIATLFQAHWVGGSMFFFFGVKWTWDRNPDPTALVCSLQGVSHTPECCLGG